MDSSSRNFGQKVLSTMLSILYQYGVSYFKPIFVLVFCFLFPVLLQAQEVRTEYFSENKYTDYPLISFKENFLNHYVYFIDGMKASPREVRAYLEIMPGDANEFGNNHARNLTGSALKYTGLTVNAGALVYVFTNQLTPQNIRPVFFATIGEAFWG